MMKGTAAILLLLYFCHSCYSQPMQNTTRRSSGDPCLSFKLLENIANRDPDVEDPSLVDDSKLTPGWHGAPGSWELLDKYPGVYRCGTWTPVYRSSKGNGSSKMCYGVNSYECFYIETRMCGSREIYYLKKTQEYSGYCFFRKDPCTSSPCANGGTCKSGNTSYTCICASVFTGRACTDCIQQPKDILILEDVSRSVGKSFEKVRRFEQSLLSPFTINPDADNVAYVVFSTNARVVFSLSEYKNSKSSVLAALKNQTYENGSTTDIVEAINVAVNSVFTPAKGDRPDADNVVIMFTDGFDTETKRVDIQASIPPLHAKAEVFVVALSNLDANSTVNILASEPGNIFQIGSNAAVSSVQTRLKSCKISGKSSK